MEACDTIEEERERKKKRERKENSLLINVLMFEEILVQVISSLNYTLPYLTLSQNSDFVTDESLSTLREMFPSTSQSELRHCLGMSGGDLEQAVMLLLNRQEDDFENGCVSSLPTFFR